MNKKISIKRLVTDFLEDRQASQENYNPDFLIKHATDIVSKLLDDSLAQWKYKIALLTVENYSVVLPDDFKKVIEAAYWMPPEVANKWEITQYIYKNIKDDCDLEINIKCPECYEGTSSSTGCNECDDTYIEVNLDDIWRNAHPELHHMYNKFFNRTSTMYTDINRSSYHNSFQLLTPSLSPFFATEYHIPTCRNLGVRSHLGYKIEKPKLIVNFREGLILFAYYGLELDEDSLPTIPDYPRVVETVHYYLDEKTSYINWLVKKNKQDFEFFQAARALRLQSMNLAMNDLNPFDVKEFWANIKKHWMTRAGRPYDKQYLK